MCGGPHVHKEGDTVPQSLRARLLIHLADKDVDLYNQCVQAEDFKDYFKADAYGDLLAFEDDIALLSTLIIICLESPGSLVELGMFCNKEQARKRLLVIVPQHKVENRDSFIYLGPLMSLIKDDSSSVLIYPWPDKAAIKYDHLDVIHDDIRSKLSKIDKSNQFDINNNAHLALLIYEITRVSYPIKLTEIELALLAIGIDVDQKTVVRLLYLLGVMKLVYVQEYSSTTFYYTKANEEKRINFGKGKDGTILDQPNIVIRLRQSFVLSTDESSKKRMNVLKLILAKQPKEGV